MGVHDGLLSFRIARRSSFSDGTAPPAVCTADASVVMCPLLELQVRLRCFELYGPRLAPNGTYFITPPSLWEGREESSGEGQSDRNSVSGLNNEVRPPRPLPRPTLPQADFVAFGLRLFRICHLSLWERSSLSEGEGVRDGERSSMFSLLPTALSRG